MYSSELKVENVYKSPSLVSSQKKKTPEWFSFLSVSQVWRQRVCSGDRLESSSSRTFRNSITSVRRVFDFISTSGSQDQYWPGRCSDNTLSQSTLLELSGEGWTLHSVLFSRKIVLLHYCTVRHRQLSIHCCYYKLQFVTPESILHFYAVLTLNALCSNMKVRVKSNMRMSSLTFLQGSLWTMTNVETSMLPPWSWRRLFENFLNLCSPSESTARSWIFSVSFSVDLFNYKGGMNTNG